MRCLLLAVMTILVLPLHAESHRFEPGKPQLYFYEMRQDVVWHSAGDVLNFSTELYWEFKLYPRKVASDEAEIEVEILSLRGKHHGPGILHEVNFHHEFGNPDDHKDPMLGGWAAMVDVPLLLTINPQTGHVSSVSGQEGIIKNLKAANPGPPGEPSPIAAAAEAAYTSQRMAALWSRLLELPSKGDGELKLDTPFAGQVQRQWSGNRYTLTLIEGATPRLVLAGDPTPISLNVESLSGEGAVSLRQGTITRSEGALQMELAGSALTQGLKQSHSIAWQMGLIELGPAIEPAPPQTGLIESEPDPNALEIQVTPSP